MSSNVERRAGEVRLVHLGVVLAVERRLPETPAKFCTRKRCAVNRAFLIHGLAALRALVLMGSRS